MDPGLFRFEQAFRGGIFIFVPAQLERRRWTLADVSSRQPGGESRTHSYHRSQIGGTHWTSVQLPIAPVRPTIRTKQELNASNVSLSCRHLHESGSSESGRDAICDVSTMTRTLVADDSPVLWLQALLQSARSHLAEAQTIGAVCDGHNGWEIRCRWTRKNTRQSQ